MLRNMCGLMLAALAVAMPLAAQDAPKPPAEGDLIPRAGTLMYMVSDRPDVLYRVFGVDKKGNWRLRALMQDSLNREFKDKPDSDEARNAQQILDYVFGSYEAMEQVEVGLVDVTLDGPKYMVHIKLKPGKKIDLKPEFLKEFLSRSIDYRDMKYLLYRIDKDGPENPEETPKEPGEPQPGEKGPGPRPENYFGMNRYYVAEVGNSILITNFESTMREGIDRYFDADRTESLSGRPEFIEWRTARKKHDLSVFVIGREIQNLIERLLPSKEQAGVDAEKIYNQIDSWIQFREYRYVVFDLDYEEAVRGLTMAATIKTRRPTKFLEKFAVESKKFTALRYVPAGAVVTLGAQLGDAKSTWGNLVELARDMEKVGDELEESGLLPFGRRAEPPRMPDGPDTPDKPETPEKPKAPEGDNPWLPKTVGPMKLMDQLGDILKAQDMGEGESSEPGEGGEGGEGSEGSEGEEKADSNTLDEALKELDKALAEFGTSTDELLGVIGDQVVLFAAVDAAGAKTKYRRGITDLINAGAIGMVINLRDADKAAAIIARAREKDPEGTFKGMETVSYQGITFNVSAARPYGYAITKDALLITFSMDTRAEDSSPTVIATLKSMVDASLKGERTGFTAEGSKFLEIDWGLIARIERDSIESNTRRLDRYARPPLDVNVNEHMTDFTFALRTREAKDSIELAMRITGLPDVGALFEDTRDMLFEGRGSDRDAFSYSEENLRAVGNLLRKEAEGGKAIDLDALVKGGKLRAGHLQTPFDTRWKGSRDKLGWVTLDQVKRDEAGKLPSWVDAAVAEAIEANENAGWNSFKLAPGDIAKHLQEYATGMIVMYQEKPDTLGGHLVLYADGQFGWLHAEAFAQALKLNAEGKPVPAEDTFDSEADEAREAPKEGANPWLPEGKEPGTGGKETKPPVPPKREDGDGIDRPND